MSSTSSNPATATLLISGTASKLNDFLQRISVEAYELDITLAQQWPPPLPLVTPQALPPTTAIAATTNANPNLRSNRWGVDYDPATHAPCSKEKAKIKEIAEFDLDANGRPATSCRRCQANNDARVEKERAKKDAAKEKAEAARAKRAAAKQ